MEETQLSSDKPLTSLLQNIFNPTFLEDFRKPFEQFPVVYIYHSADSEPEELVLDEIYPFMTVQDLKTYIYLLKGKALEYHPSFQSLLVPLTDFPSSERTEQYFPLDFAFVQVDKKGRIQNTIQLSDPYTRILATTSVDSRFVDDKGDRRFMTISDRSNSTLEDIFPELYNKAQPVLHLFLFNDVKEYASSDITTNREWNGRIFPYYPELKMNYEEELQEESEVRFLETKVNYVEATLSVMDSLNTVLTDYPLQPIIVSSMKFIRLYWKEPTTSVPDVDTLFYQIPVTSTMPFLRILPYQNVPITKIHVTSPLRIPSFDPRLIEQWAEQKALGKTDFLFGKVMIREEAGIDPALFGTLRISKDRSADFILQPPKNLKKLNFAEILKFPSYLEDAIEGTYLETTDVEIGEAAIVCNLPKIGLKDVTKQQFLRRLKYFGALFQEIPALPNENPVAMLRYRAVSKFTTEDKIFTFLTQYNSRKTANGDVNLETFVQEMVQALMYAFKVRFSEAKSFVAKWTEQKGKFTLNVAETRDFILQYNKGIDIAVFAQQSSYSFHLYRVTSSIHLRRILTALSLLLSVDDSIFAQYMPDSENLDEIVEAEDQEVTEHQASKDIDEDFTGEVNQSLTANAFGLEFEEEEVLEQTQPVAVTKPAQPVAKPTAKPAFTNTTKPKSLREYFTKRLYDADESLFPKTMEKGKEVQPYSVKCQATNDRQPNVLTENQYRTMLDIYKDADVTFLEFPLTEAVPKTEGEIVYVLKYGSSNNKLNYYICCKYFCVKDDIMVLENDFKGTHYRPIKEDKDGNEVLKQPNSCPFCGGLLITDKKNPKANEWVYMRKEKENNFHVGLLTRTVHPQGLYQPCCFGTAPTYRATEKQFEHLKYVTEEEEEANDAATVASVIGSAPISYSLTLSKAYKKYIVEKNKFPLEMYDQGGPQIGLLLPILDSYFMQEDSVIVHNPSQKQELKPSSQAFLRIGVNNTAAGRPESFFSAVAPFLLLNSADEVRQKIKDRLDPRNFLFLNYGNLLLEFYTPSDKEPTVGELNTWLQTESKLQVEVTGQNKEYLVRLYKSYNRFLRFLDDRKQLKEYRQFAQMLALPGFLCPRGVVFVVLDIVKTDTGEKLEVRCPPFGYNGEMYGDADVAFIIHHYTGAWEPIFFNENIKAHKRFGDYHEANIVFQRSRVDSWPDIVKKRVNEFTQKCAGPGRAAWTSSTGVDPFALISVGRALQTISVAPEGVIRDAFNHIVGLTYRAEPGKLGLVAVPVVDDGTIVTPANVHFDWDDFKAARIDQVIKFYNESITPFFTYYDGYDIQYQVLETATNNSLVAVRLGNGIFIPVSPLKPGANAASKKLVDQFKAMPINTVQEMEWVINRDIIFGKKTTNKEEIVLKSSERRINEAFEYLRLSFSNWFSSDEVSGELREKVRTIIFSKTLPLFEKRKRLDIIFGNTILDWMDTKTEFTDEQKSLLRVDCRLATEETCTGMCGWKQDEGVCKLHVPPDENEIVQNVPLMLMRRLIEELLRFPERRRQLLEKQVSPLVTLKQAVLIDNQYIIPESSMAWYDLMRHDWLETSIEKKKYYEEISSESNEVVYAPPSETNALVGAVPAALKEFLDMKGDEFYLYRPEVKEGIPTIQPFLVSVGVFSSDIGLDDEAYALTEDAARELVLRIRRPVIQITMDGENLGNYFAFGPAKNQVSDVPLILVVTDIDLGGPAMLSMSPTKPIPVPVDKMTFGLTYIYEERTPVIG